MTLEEFTSRYKYNIDRDIIGKGGFGSVFKAFDDVRDKYVAVKISMVVPGKENMSLLKEVELARDIPPNRNILHYECCFRFSTPSGKFDYAVTDYYPAGNLSELLLKKDLNFYEKETIAFGIISGLDHLHQNNVIHRDMKSGNILVAERSEQFVPKIADFGLSKKFAGEQREQIQHSIAGTGSLLYMAPEQLRGSHISENADIWSLGVILYELFTNKLPFYPNQAEKDSQMARKEVIEKICNATLPASINNIVPVWKEVIKGCLIPDPDKRISNIKMLKEVLRGVKTIEKEDIHIYPPPEFFQQEDANPENIKEDHPYLFDTLPYPEG